MTWHTLQWQLSAEPMQSLPLKHALQPLAQAARGSTLGQQPVLDGEGRGQRPFMVQDVDREQQVVIVHLTLVLPSHYDRPLILGLLRAQKNGDRSTLSLVYPELVRACVVRSAG